MSWNKRLRHERGRVAGVAGDVLHHVLVEHELVGHAQQRVEAHVDLGLAPGGDLVVLHLDLDPEPLHHEDHLRAQVLEVVHRRDGEVTLLVAGLEAEVRLLVAARVPDALDRVDLVEGGALVLGETDVVEDEELRLRPEVDGVGDPGGLEVALGLQGHVAGVTGVALERDRVVHEAVEVQRLVLAEGVEDGGGGVREQDHVGLLDLLEAPDGRPVEAEPFHEGVLGQLMSRHREVLHQAGEVAEADVDDLDLPSSFIELNDFSGGAVLHVSSLVRPVGRDS